MKIKNKVNELYNKGVVEKLIYNKIFIYVQNPLPEDFDLDYVIQYIEKRVPSEFVYLIDSIFIGQYELLNKRDINASYHDGAIYITNSQHDERDMIDDIVHEMSHAFEDLASSEIYFDGEIEQEFLGKRQRLCSLLQSENYNIPTYACLELEYDKNFDEFLYKEVGYEKLVNLTMGLFMSPYAATSLREYFANGFEAYFIGNKEELKDSSPALFNKIQTLETSI